VAQPANTLGGIEAQPRVLLTGAITAPLPVVSAGGNTRTIMTVTGTCSTLLTVTLGAMCLALACAGCSGPSAEFTTTSSLNCVDDSPQCVASRQSSLRRMVADKDKTWVKQPADAQAHASGVRLFALRQRRRDLTCDELAHGKREADAAPAVLRANAGKLTHAQVARGVILAGEVSRDLGREQAKRCGKS
jgi:hypothetical protein